MNIERLGAVSLIIISYLQYMSAESVAEQVADSIPAAITVDNDTVALPGYTDLEEFVIVEKKKLVESDGAKLTYNVTEDPESGSSNILEILRKVPGVTVDAEDNVKVNGQSSFKILMNGHEDPMLKGDLKTVLKSIPASTIKKIEVISEPGAKYEAEGVGGILNIVTDRSRTLSGFMTQLSGWVNAYQAGGYVNGRFKAGKVMLDATVNYNNGKIWPRSTTGTSETLDLTGGPNHLQRNKTNGKNGWDYTGANFNMSWEPDTLNLMTLTLYYSNNSWGGKRTEDRTMYGNDMSELWTLHRDNENSGHYDGLGVSASYQHTFGREDHTLVASYEFDYGWQSDESRYTVLSTAGSLAESPFSLNSNKNRYGTHIFQIDYSNKLDKHNLLEAGGKVNMYPNRTDSRPYYGTEESDAVMDENKRVDMRQFRDIYAVYTSWSGDFDKWHTKAGVRYEHTRMGLKYEIGDFSDFTTRLNDVVPNAAVSYNFTSASSLRAAYQMRISRPGISRLSPYIDTMTPGMISYGNPDLKSQKGHNISLTYSNYEGKFSGSAKVNYRYVANMVTDVIFMKDNLLNTTYENIGKCHSVSFDVNGDWTIIPDLRWSVYGSATYNYMWADTELVKAKDSGWDFYVSTNLNYTLPCKVRLSGYGGFYTPWRDFLSKGTANGYYYGLGASRSFLKDDALTLQLSLGNILPAKRTGGWRQENESAIITNNYCYSQWNVGLNISFKFGGLKAGVKRTAANIEKESDGGNGGNGGNKGGN